MKADAKIASVSDIHFGHKNTPTRHIVKNWRTAFPNVRSTHELDAIFIGGDLFDRLLHLNEEDPYVILAWAADLLAMAERHNVHVYLMEGTPSHDWRQNRMLEVLREIGFAKNHFHYVETLSIEYVEAIQGHVLFVPDEWRPEPDDTWLEVRELLREKNLEKVDLTILHGMFDFQVPHGVKIPHHVSQRYEEITRYHVLGAHIHKPMVKGNVLVNGSFDRLTHGEEEDKGHWRIDFPQSGGTRPTFMVNKAAMIYKTIDCTGLTLDDALDQIAALAVILPEGSRVRVQARKGDSILASFDVLRKRYDHIHWSSKATEAEVVQKNLLVDLRDSFTKIQITPENIQDMILEQVASMGVGTELEDRCRTRLREFI